MTDRLLLESASNVLQENGSFVLLESAVVAGQPSAPTIGVAVKGNASAQVPFTAGSDGGFAITSYTAISNPGSITGVLSQAGSGTITVSGLTNGTSYTFTVHSTNSVGNSPESGISNAVVPSTIPGAPSLVAGSPGNTQVTVSFTAPLSNGGAAITGYRVTASSGQIVTGSASPIVVTTLTNGAPVTFTVAALNLNGYGAESSSSLSVTPSTVVSILVLAPYLTTDTVPATPIYQIYDFNGNAVGGAATTGFTAISSITNGYWVLISVTPNGSFGDFAGIAVFTGINTSQAAAVELYSPPTTSPSSLVICKIAPFMFGDTLGTPGYQLYDTTGAAYSGHVTGSTIWTIPGVTNGRAVKLTLPVGANNGAQFGIDWDA